MSPLEYLFSRYANWMTADPYTALAVTVLTVAVILWVICKPRTPKGW